MFAPVLLLLAAILYRTVVGMLGSTDMHGMLHNFSPIAAIALCGAIALPRRMALFLPIAALFASDLALNLFHYHEPMLTADILPRYLVLVAISGIGFALRKNPSLPRLLAGSLVGSFLFYLVTNTGSWFHDPAYAKTTAGWLQALTVGDGVPTHPSTLWFYRHTIASDLIFTLLFAVSFSLQRSRQTATAPAMESATTV